MKKADRPEQEILSKYRDGIADAKEQFLVHKAFNNYLDEVSGERTALNDEAGERIFAKLPPVLIQKQRGRQRKLWQLTGVAAGFAVVIAGLWLFQQNKAEQSATKADLTRMSMVSPGKQAATLTLSNGKTVALSADSSAELPGESGVKISKTANGQVVYQMAGENTKPDVLNTLSTAKGQTYVLQLPDGTRVWLNSLSKIVYHPGLLVAGKRVVELTGEAYFEVKKDGHPFIVKSGSQEVEVLGTKFNISCYPEDPIMATTLTEGSVRLRNGKSVLMLKPGQQASNNGQSLSARSVDVASVIAWKDGLLKFNNQPLKDIAKYLERWYNVDIEIDSGLKSREFTGKISMKRDLKEVLQMLQLSNNMDIQMEGRRIRIIRK